MPRGAGRVYHRAFRDKHGRRKYARTWTIEYYDAAGIQQREPAHAADYDTAFNKLIERLHNLGRGLPSGLRAERLTFADLAGFIRRDYEAKRNRSGRRLAQHLGHLQQFFGERALALSMTAARFVEYRLARRKAGAAEGTINLELAAAKRMFRLARGLGELLEDHVPLIQIAPLDNARQGVITPVQMAAFLALFGEQLARVLEISYITGWRAFSEVLTRQWPHVLWEEGVLALVQGEGKARKERKFPLFPRLRGLLKQQRAWTDAEEARLEMTIPWVFHHRGGRPIRHYRRSWITACAELAKIHPDWRPEEWIRHRMRYSAVENLLGAGFSDVQVCKMVGMSPATLHRYHQLTPANLMRAGAKLNEMFPVQGISPRVLSFPEQAEK